jgi:DNA-binding CsgD family transcriptional regulator
MEYDAHDAMGAQYAYRPIERCVLRMSAAGLDDEEIGARFRRSPSFPARVRAMSALHESPRNGTDAQEDQEELRPLERVVLHRLSEGISHAEIARRLHRQEGFVEFVEAMAEYKLDR